MHDDLYIVTWMYSSESINWYALSRNSTKPSSEQQAVGGIYSSSRVMRAKLDSYSSSGSCPVTVLNKASRCAERSRRGKRNPRTILPSSAELADLRDAEYKSSNREISIVLVGVCAQSSEIGYDFDACDSPSTKE